MKKQWAHEFMQWKVEVHNNWKLCALKFSRSIILFSILTLNKLQSVHVCMHMYLKIIWSFIHNLFFWCRKFSFFFGSIHWKIKFDLHSNCMPFLYECVWPNVLQRLQRNKIDYLMSRFCSLFIFSYACKTTQFERPIFNLPFFINENDIKVFSKVISLNLEL